jgi:hypothetical protein
MHALLAYLNGVSGCPRGRARRDEGLEVLNVLLMRNASFVRNARSQVGPTEPKVRKLGRSNTKSYISMQRRSV